ncbi:hypothetical protein FE374_12020 [Georgenia yuyongxinii]|uniref:VOC domain-containing protein n=1 Tax=Georgenia yuyongxinii TaxID=2589797 RepID=A0A5B8C4J8_9MICO|nr:hypothetical protein [Georgenia yuyongxinii]QDC25238.1 hypothetical protein FE374_12020 [Georgenia yuyongxinii]
MFTRAYSGFSVDDAATARDFYTGTLGLDIPEVRMGQGLLRRGGPPIAWFTDPAGNILSVLQAGRP